MVSEIKSDSAAVAEFASAITREEAIRNIEIIRGDWLSMWVVLGVAVLVVEPNTNRVLKASPVGKYFAQVKIESSQTAPQTAKATPKFVNPLPGAVITSRYAPCTNSENCRVHPVTGQTSAHNGIDISKGRGSAVLAIADGKIIDVVSHCTIGELYCGGMYGNLVRTKHDNGYESLLTHLNTTKVSVGQRVKAGDVVGTEGTTGMSSGDHVHFELRKPDGQRVDPESEFTWQPHSIVK